MGAQAEGRASRIVFIEEVTHGTKPTTPPGYVLPFTTTDINPGDGYFDYEEIDGESYPSFPTDARHAPAGRISTPLHWSAGGWILKHAIGIPVTTGASDPYTHVFELGHTTGEAAGFEIERQQSDITNVSQLFWGGRFTTFGITAALEGAVMFDCTAEFLRYDPWSSSYVVSSPTVYTDQRIDEMIGVIKIGGSAKGYVSAFNLTTDWQIDTDNYSVFYQGWRWSLPRGKPKLMGSMEVFLNDDTMTDLIGPAEAGTYVNIDIEYIETALTRALMIDMNDIGLKITGSPIETVQGLKVTFDWRGWGDDCFIATLYNSIASY